MSGQLTWQREDLFFDGDDYFEHLIKSISQAKDSVDMEFYIFERDQLGNHILAELKKVQRRGVRVRLLIDGIGSHKWNHEQLKSLKDETGIEAHFFNEPVWRQLLFQRPPEVSLSHQITRGFRKMNKRNHRKMCIIDNNIAFVGSFNIASYHCKMFAGKKAWRDTGMRVEGEGVEFLGELFEYTWERALHMVTKRLGGQVLEPISRPREVPSIIRTNFSGRLRRSSRLDLLDRIGRAQKSISVTTPYFVPSRGLVKRLMETAERGIKVQILTPRLSDIPLMRWTAAEFYAQLLKSGVEIYEYLPSVLHAKTARIDDWGIVGSTNLNHRSLLHDLEIDLEVTHPENLKKMDEAFKRDLKHAEKIELASIKNRPWYEKWVGRNSLLFRYWL